MRMGGKRSTIPRLVLQGKQGPKSSPNSSSMQALQTAPISALGTPRTMLALTKLPHILTAPGS